MKLWSKWKGLDARIRIILMLTVIALQLWFISFMSDTIEQSKLKRSKHIYEHKCERVGFAGIDAIPVFKCDNGIWLQNELPR